MIIDLLTLIVPLCTCLFPQSEQDSLPQPRSIAIDEIVVTGTRNESDSKYLTSTVSVIDREIIELSHESSLLPLLNSQIPGTFVTSRGILGYGVSTGAAGGITFRGVGNSPTTGALVLIDGHPQYMGLMGHPIADAYQSVWAEKVEVIKGPSSVLYGSNAMGGVVNIITRHIENGTHTDAHIGYGSFNTITSSITNRTQIKRFGSTVSAFYNRTDGHRADMGFEQMGGYLKLSYTFSENWLLTQDLNLSHFNASNPGPVGEPLIDNDSHITRGMTSLSLQNHYKNTSGGITAFFNWGRHHINDGYSPGEPPLDYRFNSADQMAGLSLYQSIRFNTGSRFTAGVDYQHFGGKAWNHFLSNDNDQTIVDKKIDDLAGYIDASQDLGSQITLNAGLRFDHNSHTGNEWIPQGGAAVHLPRNIELKLTVGKGFRNPTIREMYMFPPQNPNLQPERLVNYEIAFSQQLPPYRFSYNIHIFYLQGNNLIQAVRVANGMLNMNTGKVENLGLETEIKWQISSAWRFTAQYSWLHMKKAILASPEHKVSTTVYYRKKAWSASTDIQYVHGLYIAVDSPQKEKFILWNARINYQINRFLRIFAKGENLLAQRYEINQGFPMPKATCLGGLDVQF